MKNRCLIIVDLSGSMHEMGKIYLQRNLCQTIAQLPLIDTERYAGVDFIFYRWTQEISEFSMATGDNAVFQSAAGSARLDILGDFLANQFRNEGSIPVILLTDGAFPDSDIECFKKKLADLPSALVRAIPVGADADLQKLKKLCDSKIHLAEDIPSAIDALIIEKTPPEPPARAGDIATSHDDAMDDWDD